MSQDPFNARRTLEIADRTYQYCALDALESAGLTRLSKLPFSVRVLLEALLRGIDGFRITRESVEQLARYDARNVEAVELPFTPGRVVLQDFTGVPCVVDLAAMRDAMGALEGDPSLINPEVPCDLVIDHSVQVDAFGSDDALATNARFEFERNAERYEFLKWGQQSLDNFTVVPPATGIVHQVNLEFLARGALSREHEGTTMLYPDSLVGTDSHTTMINALGVLGWGVGGIEAEAVMLGQPVFMLTPEVVGFRLTGRLPEGTTATDLVLTVTQMLRAHGVVEKFVEFFGPGLSELAIPDRATIANMAPEYGATCGFFPVDAATVAYFRATARPEAAELAEAYSRANHLFREDDTPEPEFSSVLELDLTTVEPSLAGPRRPQDRVALSAMRSQWHKDLVDTFGKTVAAKAASLVRWAGEGGAASAEASNPAEAEAAARDDGVRVRFRDEDFSLHHGDVVIAAITSCTNTSNPDVMIAAGLLARRARALGITSRPWVKTSLAPGSKVVTEYLEKSGLDEDLDALGFHTVGYGCTTCIGNSGPLPSEIEDAVRSGDLVAASVLSGNRNFEGRIHPAVRANYLASPPLVVAYAIAGTVDIDLQNDPLATSRGGEPVYLRDLWPSQADVLELRAASIDSEAFSRRYGDVYSGNETWNAVPVTSSDLYPWRDESTYIQNPPFFTGMTRELPVVTAIEDARCLAFLGDSVTTDHISPAGAIAADSPAGRYLGERGVERADFNSYGSRRGNDRVMTRGTFANVRVRNRLAADELGNIPEGGWTRDFTQGEGRDAPVVSIFDAAETYREAGVPLVVLAGSDYGMGSSRDWAAKGTFLLGVRAVIAQSFERIHRSNLVFMGVLPLVFRDGDSAQTLGLDGSESFTIALPEDFRPRQEIEVRVRRRNGESMTFSATCRIDTPVEADYYRHGGILQAVLRNKLHSE